MVYVFPSEFGNCIAPPLYFVLASLAACCHGGHISLRGEAGITTELYEEPGDVNIAGLFPIHSPDMKGNVCGKVREIGVLQRVEAMAHTIREINLNGSLIPGVKLGFYIADDCYKDTVALAQGLHFVQVTNECDIPTSHTATFALKPLDVVAIIGAESSTNSKKLAELLGLFQIPQVSYFSTSTELSNKLKYPFFSRIMCSDAVQVSAIITLMHSMHWSYFSFVYSLNNYGISAYLQILHHTGVTGVGQRGWICMAAQRGISEDADDDEYNDTLDLLMSPPNGIKAKVVILYLNQMQAWKFLSVAQERKLHGEFVWIGSDAWGRNSQDFYGIEDIAQGSLHVKLASHSYSNFDQYFRSLTPALAVHNPWFEQFWMAHHACSNNCSTYLHFSGETGYKEETTVSLVRDAVYLVAQGISRIQRECLNDGMNASCRGSAFRQRITGANLQANIRSFQGRVNTDRFTATATADGDGNRKYFFQNFRKIGGNYRLAQVGEYLQSATTSTQFTFNKSALDWHPSMSLEPSGFPASLCSEECPPRHQKVRSLDNLLMCCWKCVPCEVDEYTYLNNDEGGNGGITPVCQQCRPLFYDGFPIYQRPDPNQNYTTCSVIVPRYFSWYTTFAWPIMLLFMILLAGTCVILGFYIKFRDSKLIKATDSKLCYIIFSGAIFSHLGSLCFFIRPLTGCDAENECSPVPIKAVCYIDFVIFNLAFTIMYAPILTRSNRIYRIFKAGLKSPRMPRFAESKYQVAITGIIIGVQTAILSATCIPNEFHGKYMKIENIHILDEEQHESVLTCNIEPYVHIAPVCYNIFIVSACAFHAVKNRKLPHNYNESKFIAFCVFSACVLWLANLGSYFVLTSSFYQPLSLSGLLTLHATLPICCLFVPRIYAVHYVRDSRERSLSAAIRGSVGTSTPRNSIVLAAHDELDCVNQNAADSVAITATSDPTIDAATEDESGADGNVAKPNSLGGIAARAYSESYTKSTVLQRGSAMHGAKHSESEL